MSFKVGDKAIVKKLGHGLPHFIRLGMKVLIEELHHTYVSFRVLDIPEKNLYTEEFWSGPWSIPSNHLRKMTDLELIEEVINDASTRG